LIIYTGFRYNSSKKLCIILKMDKTHVNTNMNVCWSWPPMQKKLFFVVTLLVSMFFNAEAFAAPADNAARAVVRLRGNDSSGNAVFATGFLIQPESAVTGNYFWLVTAAHIFETCTETITVGFRRKNNGVFSEYPVAVKIRDNGRAIYSRHSEYDIGALKITAAADIDSCLLAHDFIGDDKMLEKCGFGMGCSLLIVGYPYGEACNDAGFAYARTAVVSSFPVLPSSFYPVFHADFEVFAGYSGAPVILNDGNGRFCLAGMVLEEVFLEEIESSRKKKTLRTRRGLGLARALNSAIIKDFLRSVNR